MLQRLFRCGFVFGLCLTLASIFPCCSGKPRDPASSAPDFNLKTIDGQDITLSGLRGKVVLLDFWATWCGPCKESIPHLIQLYKNYQDKGLTLIGMNTDPPGNIETVHRFIRTMEIPYPMIMTPERVARAFEIRGLPTVVIIDKKGSIREKIVGYNHAIGQRIDMKIMELTSENP